MRDPTAAARQRMRDKNRGVRDFKIRLEKDEKDRKRVVTISFSSEEPYDRWFGPEILSHADGAVQIERLNEIGVVLFNHNRDKVVGKILEAWIENGRGCANIEFDDDPESEHIFKKVQSGTLKGVSVGYCVSRWEEVEAGKQSADGRFQGPCSIATLWEPLEVSIVSVPADASVGVGRNFDDSGEYPICPVESGRSTHENQLAINKNLL